MINDGILVLNKPQNWTSHDCVAICRRVLRLKGVKKIGHGGTLDPMAEGVLPIFIGQATRIMEYLELDYKTYICEMQLGITTDSQDIWGNRLSERSFEGITEEEIRQAAGEFEGVIEQMPPIYSAVRIDGKHLYEYARKGRSDQELTGSLDPEIMKRIKLRRVHVRRLDLLDIDAPGGKIRFLAECSKGTYIRTICHELGRKLGCGACMTALQRTAIGRIDLSRSVSPEEVKRMDAPGMAAEAGPDLESLLLPPDAPLQKFGEVIMPPDRAKYFRQGNSIRLKQVRIARRPDIAEDILTGQIPENARGRRYDRIYRVYEEGSGLFIGTGFEDRDNNVLRADKVFMPLNEPKETRPKETRK